MRHIDTAERYGRGVVEQMAGEAIAGRRHEVFALPLPMPNDGYAGSGSPSGVR